MPAVPVSADAAERLRLRYPPSRLSRRVMIGAAAVLGAVFLAWVLWTAAAQANPPVSAQVPAYQVLNDREVAVTVTVQRPDPSLRAFCNVVAQAADFQVVGALTRLEIPPRSERVVNVTTTIKTLRRATSASVRGCSLA